LEEDRIAKDTDYEGNPPLVQPSSQWQRAWQQHLVTAVALSLSSFFVYAA
jgi:hypothetical protein